jgi:hypothetical protein
VKSQSLLFVIQEQIDCLQVTVVSDLTWAGTGTSLSAVTAGLHVLIETAAPALHHVCLERKGFWSPDFIACV